MIQLDIRSPTPPKNLKLLTRLDSTLSQGVIHDANIHFP